MEKHVAEVKGSMAPTFSAIALGVRFWNKNRCMRRDSINWLFLNPIKSQGWGGMENWMLKLCRGLRERGDHCLVVGRPASPWPDMCRAHDIAFEPCRFGVDFAPWVILRLRRIAASFRPDIVIAKGFRQVRFARVACPGVTLGTKMPMADELTDAWADRLTVNLCVDRILVDSHTSRRAFLKHPWVLPGKIAAVHNGVAIPAPADRAGVRERLCRDLGFPSGTVLVGGAGRFTAEKRYADALRAFAASARLTDTRLVLFGEGPERDALKGLAVSLGVADRVFFPGWRDNLREWMPAFDIVVHPSAVEGLPNVVLEAMAGGVAVVASDAGGTREIFTRPDIGRVFRAGDLPALSGHLAELLRDPDMRRALGANAAAHVTARFSIPVMVDAIRNTMAAAMAARKSLSMPAVRSPGASTCTIQRADTSLPEPFETMAAPDATPVSDSTRSKVVRIERGGERFFLKRFRYTPALVWRYAWRMPEALANFRTAHRLELAGADVVPHLAASWRRRLLQGESVLVTGVIEGAEPLDRLLADSAALSRFRRIGPRALALWLAHLHAAGIAPHDLKASNVLVVDSGTSAPRFVLLDLDNARIYRTHGVTAHAAERNLHQCFRSFQRVLTRKDVLGFVARYRAARRLPRPVFRRMLAVVERRLHRRGTGFAELS